MRTLDDLEVEGRRVLVRADLNVPLKGGEIVSDTRILASLLTIEELRRRGARVVIVAHLGRPSGRDPACSLRPVAKCLGELTDANIVFCEEIVGEGTRRLSEELGAGEVLLLENVRFEDGEIANDRAFAARLAALADISVDDSFGTVNRAHASVEALAGMLARWWRGQAAAARDRAAAVAAGRSGAAVRGRARRARHD